MDILIDYEYAAEWQQFTKALSDKVKEHFNWKIGTVLATVGAAVILRRYHRGARFELSRDVRMTGKTILITGSTRGEGLVLASEFAKMNARVIIAGENQQEVDDVEELIRSQYTRRGTLVTYGTLDMMNQNSVIEFARRVCQEEKTIHVLVNNASVFDEEPRPSLEGYERQMVVNHLNHVLLTDLMMAKLKSTFGSRIVFRTTGSHEQAEFDINNMSCENFYDSRLSYCNSQLANVLYARALASKEFGVKVHVSQVETSRMERMRRFRWPCFMMQAMAFPIKWSFTNNVYDRIQNTLHTSVYEELESGGFYQDCEQVEWSHRLNELQSSIGEDLYATSRKMVGRKTNLFGLFTFEIGYRK